MPVAGPRSSGGRDHWQQKLNMALMLALLFAVIAVFLQNFFLLGHFNDLKTLLRSGLVTTKVEQQPTDLSPKVEQLLAAFVNPCKLTTASCDPQVAEEQLLIELSASIDKGRSKSEIFDDFVVRYGMEILSPQAQAVYKRANR